MSLDLDAIATRWQAIGNRNRTDYRIRRIEETLLILNTIVTKTFHNAELQHLYDKHIDEIRQEINNVSQDKQDIADY